MSRSFVGTYITNSFRTTGPQ